MQEYCKFCRSRQLKQDCAHCGNKEPFLLEKNWQATDLFLACQTQYRVGFGVIAGLDYLALEKVASWLEIKIDKELFNKIRILERKVLEDCREKNE